MQSSESDFNYVLLRWQGDIVGTGKYFYFPGEKSPATTLFGSKLSWFSKRGEVLVAVCGVQIFREFEEVRYPYLYGGADDLPVFLGDLNRSEKHFKAIIAWDDRNIVENPFGSELGVCPTVVSVKSIQWYRRELASRSPRQLQFGSIYVKEFEAVGTSDENGDMAAATEAKSAGPELACQGKMPLKDTEQLEELHGNVLGEISLNASGFESQSSLQKEREDDDKRTSKNELLKGQSVLHSMTLGPHSSREHQLGSENSGSPMVVSSDTPDSQSPMMISTPSPQKKSVVSTAARNSSLELSPMVVSPSQGLSAPVRIQQSSSPSPMAISSDDRSVSGSRNWKMSKENKSKGSFPDCRRRLSFSEDRGKEEMVGTGIPGSSRAGSSQPELLREEERSARNLGLKGLSGSLLTAADPSASNLDGVHSALAEMNMAVQKRPYRFNVRRKAAPKKISTMREIRLKLSKRKDNPFLKDRTCCSRECFRNVNPNYAFAQYKRFMDMKPVERKLVLHELLDKRIGKFRFDNRVICSRFLSGGFKFSFCLQSIVKNTDRARASSSLLAKQREVRMETKRDRIVSFLLRYADAAGEKLPMKAQINLPTLKKLQVYEKFLESLQKNRITDVPTKSYFFAVWKEKCPHIKAHRYHGFTVCVQCEFLRAQLHRYATNIIAQHMFRANMRVHLQHIAEERRGYYDRCDLAVRYPEKYCSIVVDGADQQSYGLPHFVFKSKADRGHKMKVRCIGVLEHKTKNYLNLFTMTEEFATGANHVIEAIHRVLDKKKAADKRLPEILFLQADNCVRENKNRYMLAYLEMLVAMGVFLEVQVSFLPIGHTHCDIDQAFSTVSGALRTEEVITMHDLISLLKRCYGSRSSPEELTRVANISDMMEFTGCLTKVKHFGTYRYFRFTRKAATTGKVSQGPFKTACDVKVQLSDTWKSLTLENTSNVVTSFLAFVPSLRNVPVTKTKVPPNVAEVNKCIDAAVQRLDDGVKHKIDSLKSLRDRIYTQRIYNFHWDLNSCFEMSGNFLQRDVTDSDNLPRGQASDELDYEVGEFVAVKTESGEDDPFWIGKITRGANTNAAGIVSLYLRWYVPTQGSTDVYRAVYKEATRLENGKNVPYNESVDVQSVLCNFEKLTARNCLHVRTQKAIRDSLGVS